MPELSFLQSVRFVVDQHGKPAAVQMDIAVWEKLIAWLEEIEDRTVIRDALPRLRMGPYQSGALPWQEVRDSW